MSQSDTGRAAKARRRPAPPVSLFPPQHGAWAFLGLPVVLGWAIAGFTPVLVLLGVGFVVAYPASYFAIAYLRYPRRERYVRALSVWGSAGIAIAVVLLFDRPWLVWVGLAYLIAFAVNLAFAKSGNERSLTNDAVFIAECVAITPVMWGVGASGGGWVPPGVGGAPSALWVVSAFAGLALVGSTMHVRSLIRQRNDLWLRRASQVFAGVSLAIAVVISTRVSTATAVAAGLAFGFLSTRSFLVGRRPMKPGVIGMVELAGFVLVAAAGFVAAASG
ncbi:MAG: YwiC-like family protein [Candidatus Nanopelagicales bacterium]